MTPATTTAAKYLDVLPLRGGKRQAMEWQPHSEDYAHGEGFVILTSDRDRTAYAVTQAHNSGPLLCFVFTKVGGKGTDTGRASYVLTCTVNGNDAKCECKGATRHGHCRHADALETLFLNRWL